MRQWVVRAALLGVIAGAGALAGCSSIWEPESRPGMFRSLAARGAKVDAPLAASMVSGLRQNSGLGPVAIDPTLTAMAERYALAMATRNKVGHEVDGTNLQRRAESAGFRYAMIAENVGAGQDNLAEIFAGWRHSKGHLANMLMPGATRMGIAAAQAPDSKYKVFWAMVIAQPYDPAVAAATMPTGPVPAGTTIVTVGGGVVGAR